jgi:hypothetical protein
VPGWEETMSFVKRAFLSVMAGMIVMILVPGGWDLAIVAAIALRVFAGDLVEIAKRIDQEL